MCESTRLRSICLELEGFQRGFQLAVKLGAREMLFGCDYPLTARNVKLMIREPVSSLLGTSGMTSFTEKVYINFLEVFAKKK